MVDIKSFSSDDEIAWCPGCGNFGILNSLKKALVELGKNPNEVLLVSGIGQAAKLPHYINCNCFNGLHGRAIPAAVGAKIANKDLTVIVTTGDGDCYGEGGNHFIHNIRRNVDITLIVHNNQIYGLTKGQASPTTDRGYVTQIQAQGVILEPLQAPALAISLGCGFVARSFSRNSEQLSRLIIEGVKYRGFSFIEVLQPCVTFNKKNTFSWYEQRVYDLGLSADYNVSDRVSAFEKALQWGERIPTGIIYKAVGKSYEEKADILKNSALVDIETGNVEELFQQYFLKSKAKPHVSVEYGK